MRNSATRFEVYSSQFVGQKRNRNNLSMVVGVDDGDDGNDGNDSDESMWSLPVRTTVLCAYRVRV